MNREVLLTSRPVEDVGPEHFRLVRVPLPEPRPGQILVRNTWMSVDPYMRQAMRGNPYLPPLQPGNVLHGAAIGEVVDSRAAALPVGTPVSHFAGWRDYAVVDAADATVVDTTLAPAPAYLGVLGTTGLTAYAAMTEAAPVRQGDVVFVSAAAGAVGSIAGQLARKLGAAKVIGSAGGPDKARKLVTAFGFDESIDYKAGPVAEQLAKAAPDGIDYYFDNVGGEHLEAAIGALRERGRIALVGAIGSAGTGPGNLIDLAFKNAGLHGLLIDAYGHLRAEWIKRAGGWLADGTLHAEQTVIEGLEQAPAALIGVLRGSNTGKMLVHLGTTR
ncbi:MDR family NADP-dependent oxidoreductase [Streptosporangium sp. KLBMP 9127]|nr:NADP-dependent oxidoreductase [Streptosporangium sp. KLBMP 9127]